MKEFSYFQKGNQFFPLVDVKLKTEKNQIILKALVDSGATYSVFRAEIGEYLGIEIEKGKPVYLEGVGGRILGYMHNILISLDRRFYKCKIIFSRELTVSFNILGRDNFFYPFLITFFEKKRKIIFREIA